MFSVLLLASPLLSLHVLSGSAVAEPAADEEKAIGHLIEYVKMSSYQFVRNGQTYSGADAATHIQMKYKHQISSVNTAEDFIKSCASASTLSGRPYLVRTVPGEEKHVGDWLLEELKKYRASR